MPEPSGPSRTVPELDEAALAGFLAGPGDAFLYASAPWCGPCRMVGPHFQAIAAEHAGPARFGRIGVDLVPEVAERLGIRTTPTILHLRDGAEADRISGAVMRPRLAAWIAERAGS